MPLWVAGFLGLVQGLTEFLPVSSTAHLRLAPTIVGQLDVETASAAGVIEPGVAEQAVLELNVEERQELTRLLKDELTRAKS